MVLVNGQVVGVEKIGTADFELEGNPCRIWAILVEKWPPGETEIVISWIFTEEISDTMSGLTFPTGEHRIIYYVLAE